MAIEVIFAPEALADLISLYDYAAERGESSAAFAFVERIRLHCLTFALFPERGPRRDDLRPGLRTIGFERRITIAFHILPARIVIDRILYAGRDLGSLFESEIK